MKPADKRANLTKKLVSANLTGLAELVRFLTVNHKPPKYRPHRIAPKSNAFNMSPIKVILD
jgi:hypothetical protein